MNQIQNLCKVFFKCRNYIDKNNTKEEENILINIKMNDFIACSTSDKFTICTILILDRQILFTTDHKIEELKNLDNFNQFEARIFFIKQIVQEQLDTASVTNSTSCNVNFYIIVSQSQYGGKFIRDIKSGMKDKTISKSVRCLQIMSSIAGLILIIISCKILIIFSCSIFNYIQKHNQHEELT